MNKKVFVITIDGPAGSGKSTVSSMLAERLKFSFLTTGAFYRGLALMSLKAQTEDPIKLAALALSPRFKVKANFHGTQVFIDDENVTELLNEEKTAKAASRISAIPQVREALLIPQRSFEKPPGLIAEGRDCGTVVFPHADIKIFLTASIDARVRRRLTVEGRESLETRDKADSSRKAAPLMAAADAIEIDTSEMSAEEVVDLIEKTVLQRLA